MIDRLVNDLCMRSSTKKNCLLNLHLHLAVPVLNVSLLSTCYGLCSPSCCFSSTGRYCFVLFSCSCCFPPHFFLCILLLTGKLIVNVPCFIPVTVLLLRVHMYFVSLERDRTLLYRVLDDGLHQATLDPNLHISVPKLLLFFFFFL